MQENFDIQNFILSKLISGQGLRYRDMKPREVENDLYNYHLQYLVKKGYAQKMNDRYFLTDLGKHLIVNIKPLKQSGSVKDKFRVNVVCIIEKIKDGKKFYVIHRRKRAPFYGDEITTGGSVRSAELLFDSAARNANEKFGLDAKFTRLLATIRMVQFYNGELFQDIFLNFCYSNDFKGDLVQDNVFGTNRWALIDEIILGERRLQSKPLESLLYLYGQIKTHEIDDISYFYKEEKVYIEKA